MLHILISYITLRYVLFTHYLRIIYAFKMVMLKEVPKGLGIGSAGGIGSKSKGRVSYSKADVGGGDDWDDVGSTAGAGGGGGGGGSGNENKGKRTRGFPSNVQGRYIVNAVTGVEYPWRVGSVYEDLLWKVCDARASRGKFEPDFYFYDSPQQAAEHRRFHRNAFSQDSLDWWKAKVARTTKMLVVEE